MWKHYFGMGMSMKFRKEVKFRLLALLLSCVMCMTSFSMNGFMQTVNVNAAKAEEDKTALCQDPSDAEHATGLLEKSTEGTGDNTEQYTDQGKDPLAEVEVEDDLAKAVDNSQTIYFPQIGNQGGIGSCWAWSEIYYVMTYMYNRANNREVDSSNTFSPKWNYMQATPAEYVGGVTVDQCPINHFYYVSDLKNYPLDYLANEEDQYNALSVRPEWESLEWGNPSEENPTPITGPEDSDLADMKQLLANGEILNFETYVRWFNYKTIVADSAVPANQDYAGQSIVVACAGTTGSNGGGHAMTIVGYNDEIGVDLNADGVIENAEKGAFKVANSWGTSYQNNGYVWISYDAFNLKSNYCKIGTAQTQTRLSIASRIRRMKIRTDSLKYYMEYTVNTATCMGNGVQAPDNTYLSVDRCGAGIRPTFWIGDDLSANAAYNYSGTTGAADATFLFDFEMYKNNQWYDWGDLGNIYQYEQYTYFNMSGENMEDLTVKDVHFVDAENQVTYGSTFAAGSSGINFYYINKSKILPTVTDISFDKEVLKQNNTVKTTVLANDDKSGMQYEFSYQKVDGTDSGTQSKSSSNIFTWTPNETGTYRITVNVTDSDGNVITKKVSKEVVEKYQVTALTPSIASGKVTETQKVTFETEVSGTTGEVQYQYLIDGEVVRDYAASSKMTWDSVYRPYRYIITVNVKDSTGEVVTKEIEYDVNQKPYFTGYRFQPASSVTLGESVAVTISGGGGTGTLTRIVQVKKGEASYKTVASSSTSSTVNWTPSETGIYTVKMILQDENGYTASYEQPYTVENSQNLCVIYYENSSFSQAYIHYKVGDGAWTTVPGVAMESSTEQSGYSYKYVIDLGTESKATVCFNNGSGSWDSKNGANYLVEAGTYGIKNQVVTKLSTTTPTPVVTVTPTVTPTPTVTVTPTVTPTPTVTVTPTPTVSPEVNQTTIYYAGYTNPYIHYKIGAGAWTSVPGVAMAASTEQDGYTHKITIDLGTATALTVCFNDGNGNWDSNNGSNYTFGVGTYGYKNGNIVKISGQDVNDNQTIIYYKGYTTPYIHYKIGNGDWTTVPGIAMQATTEKTGYTHKITIALGDADNLTACFNDGNGNWDSNNGSNYSFGIGSYTYRSGTITKIE